MARLHERTLARRLALQALYLCLVSPDDVPLPLSDEGEPPVDLDEMSFEHVACDERIRRLVAADPELPDVGRLPAYAKELLTGVADDMGRIDALLTEVSENWSVERMPVVDHAVLLIGVHEMLEQDAVPTSVCINESVELAKEFGGEDESARFVNGVLGRIARTHFADAEDTAGAEDTAYDLVEA